MNRWPGTRMGFADLLAWGKGAVTTLANGISFLCNLLETGVKAFAQDEPKSVLGFCGQCLPARLQQELATVIR